MIESDNCNYKAMLEELLKEQAIYDRDRGNAEARWYNWFVRKEYEPEWKPLLNAAYESVQRKEQEKPRPGGGKGRRVATERSPQNDRTKR